MSSCRLVVSHFETMAAPPSLTKAQWKKVQGRLSRDVCVRGNYGPAVMVLMGLAVPVRVTSVTGETITYEVDAAVFGRATLEHHFPAVEDPTRADSDLKTLLEPALALRADPAGRVPVPETVRAAWAKTNMVETLVDIRREWLATGAHIPSLDHVKMFDGGSLEAWLVGHAARDDASTAVAVEMGELVGRMRKRSAENAADADRLVVLLGTYKRATLNAWHHSS